MFIRLHVILCFVCVCVCVCVCVFLNVYVILFSCNCMICSIVTLKLRTCCIEVNLIVFLKVAHLLVCL